MVTVNDFRKARLPEGPATVLAIGTATPPNRVDQSTYPDYYFRVTNNEDKIELKQKFKRICKFFFNQMRKIIIFYEHAVPYSIMYALCNM